METRTASQGSRPSADQWQDQATRASRPGQYRAPLAALRAEDEAAAKLFKAVVWGYFGSAAGLLALALLGISGAHIHWVHLVRGIVTGS